MTVFLCNSICLCFSLSFYILMSCTSSDPPTFIKPADETVEVTPQNQLILNCTATGNPMPVYSWQYLQPSQQTNNNQNENQPILAPSFYLPGTYRCTASNIQGTRTKYFNVIEAPGKILLLSHYFSQLVSLCYCLTVWNRSGSFPGTTAGIFKGCFHFHF